MLFRSCMLFSSTGIGMFRNVVRACLYDQTLSSPQEPVTTTFNLNQVQADIAAYTDAVQKTNNFKYLMVSSYIDANMTFAAVKLYAPDGRLIAAGSQELTTAGDNNGK